MDETFEDIADREHQLELVELLDGHFRLREDPTKRSELKSNDARLRAKLHEADGATPVSAADPLPPGADTPH